MKGFQQINHNFGKLEDWPRTMTAICEFIRKYDSEVSRQIKQASKTVNTVGELTKYLKQFMDDE
jgi:hypothetical protein